MLHEGIFVCYVTCWVMRSIDDCGSGCWDLAPLELKFGIDENRSFQIFSEDRVDDWGVRSAKKFSSSHVPNRAQFVLKF